MPAALIRTDEIRSPDGRVHYGMERCATHGWTTFGIYYEADGTTLVYGCLNCRFADRVPGGSEGTPLPSDPAVEPLSGTL